MIRKLMCWLGWHELMDCCDYCCEFIKDADCGKCSYFLFRKKMINLPLTNGFRTLSNIRYYLDYNNFQRKDKWL